jgi:replicative DNA helicase
MNIDKLYSKDNIVKLLDKYKNFSIKTVHRFDQVIKSYRDHSEFCQKNKVDLGFKKLDHMLQGIQPSEVCCIISPTDVGKTASAMNIIRHNLNEETIIANFQMENNQYQMFERMMQLETGIPFWDLQKLFIRNDEQTIESARELVKKWESCINIIHRVSVDDLLAYIKVLEELSGKRVKLVVIDYIQLIKHSISDEYTRTSDVAQKIKELSQMLMIPVIVLSQVSRESSRYGVDLYSGKGSGEIENSFQQVISLTQLKEKPVDINNDELNKIILDNNQNNSLYRPLLMSPHKLKRARKEAVVVLMDKYTLEMQEFDVPPVAVPDITETKAEELKQEEIF